MKGLTEELIERLRRLAAAERTELLAVEVIGTSRRPVVRVVIDRSEGVSLADCENVSRQASVLLDAHDPFPSAYTLEVSSPGLDRKMYAPADYARFAGRVVRVRMRPGWTGPKLVEGWLAGLSDGVVRVTGEDGAEHELPEADVFETRLAPFVEEKWSAKAARAAGKARKRTQE